MSISKFLSGKYEIIRLENSTLRVDVAPAVGGKIISIYSKSLSKEFLWTNDALELQSYPVGTSFDPFFFGGFDELLPCDLPEKIQGIDYPDHGELWTLDLNYDTNGIQEGDQLDCFVGKGEVADLAYSRFNSLEPFTWPIIEGADASIVPAKNGTMDFFYLYEIQKGEMSLISEKEDSKFTIIFDTEVFPYLWYFASYGGFLDHYTAVLEPATTMPISVNDAIDLKQCSVLLPGEMIKTRVSLYAGSLNQKSYKN